LRFTDGSLRWDTRRPIAFISAPDSWYFRIVAAAAYTTSMVCHGWLIWMRRLHLKAVAQVRDLIVCHGQLAEGCAVVEGGAQVLKGIVLQDKRIQPFDLLQTCGSGP